MGQSAPNPSDNNVRPRSLDERLKEVAKRLKVEADGEPSPGQTAERSLHLSPGQDPWVSSTLLAVLIVVSLIPTATIGVMLWQGVITTPWSIAVAPGNDSQSLPGNDSQSLEAQQTSSPSPATEMLQPKRRRGPFCYSHRAEHNRSRGRQRVPLQHYAQFGRPTSSKYHHHPGIAGRHDALDGRPTGTGMDLETG